MEFKFTESTFEAKGKLRFPDVSVCNMRGLSSSNFQKAANHSYRIHAILQELNNTHSVTDELLYLRDYVAFAGEDAKLMGHQEKDFILSCVFNKLPCREDDFEQFLFPSFINCFTFLGGRRSLVTTKGGIDSALRIVFYLEPENPFFMRVYSHRATFSYSTGIRILLTPPKHLRTIGNSGYEVLPGLSTSLVFDTIEHTRLPEPYNQCRHSTDNTQKSDVPYSFVECRNDCIHADVIKECGCQSTGFLVRNLKNVSSCGQYLLTNKSMSDTLLNCQQRVIDRAQLTPNYFKRKCQCFWPCSDTKYSMTMSQSAWPAKSSLQSFLFSELESKSAYKGLKAYKHYQFLKSSNASEAEIYSWVSNHFLRIIIYARSDLVLVKEETPKYSLTDLLSSIGGCLGLWVGVSVLTLSKVIKHLFAVSGIRKGDLADKLRTNA